MVGFEVTWNDSVTKLGVETGVTSLIFTRVKTVDRDQVDINGGGINSDLNEKIIWIAESLKVGDKFMVEVKEITEVSNPVKKELLNSNNEILQGKLRSYLAIKKELEENGLI